MVSKSRQRHSVSIREDLPMWRSLCQCATVLWKPTTTPMTDAMADGEDGHRLEDESKSRLSYYKSLSVKDLRLIINFSIYFKQCICKKESTESFTTLMCLHVQYTLA